MAFGMASGQTRVTKVAFERRAHSRRFNFHVLPLLQLANSGVHYLTEPREARSPVPTVGDCPDTERNLNLNQSDVLHQGPEDMMVRGP